MNFSCASQGRGKYALKYHDKTPSLLPPKKVKLLTFDSRRLPVRDFEPRVPTVLTALEQDFSRKLSFTFCFPSVFFIFENLSVPKAFLLCATEAISTGFLPRCLLNDKTLLKFYAVVCRELLSNHIDSRTFEFREFLNESDVATTGIFSF